MDIFKLHKTIIEEYKSYINSFINIKDERIKQKVINKLQDGGLCPEPLLQFNPSYKKSHTLEALCSEKGFLHPDLITVFKGYKTLYTHQEEALRLGVEKKDFIVTSGTGSGKSLTYIGTIFHHLLQRNSFPNKGIQAIVVYPMNALINSQEIEFEKYKTNYEEKFGKGSFLNIRKYTGQENENARKEIKENPPHILLTNYMMLELIMTRSSEFSLRNAIKENLAFLAFDELHTYRGRQGADVALLIRRIKAHAKASNICCMGTSATMASSNSQENQKKAVANVAQILFGNTFENQQIIEETLERQTVGSTPSIAMLKNSITNDLDTNASETDLQQYPLAVWLENEIALEQRETGLKRRKPMTLTEIVQKLEDVTAFPPSKCETAIQSLLTWAESINKKISHQRRAYLPFRLHQFIAQTGSVYVTLDDAETRQISLKPGYYIKDEQNNEKPIFQVVFSRLSGHEFICVRKDPSEQKLIARSFDDTYLNEDEVKTDFNRGYLIPDPEGDLWNPTEDLELLPESWLTFRKRDPRPVINKRYKERIPNEIYYNNEGKYTESWSPETPHRAWFMPVKLLFDVTCGAFYPPQTSEKTKLMRIGNEGRSTATTILSYTVIQQLYLQNKPPQDRKILSFTDNRQDAALQSGHFNDFITVGRLRSAIYHALKNSSTEELDFSTLPDAIFDSLKLPQEEYAQSPSNYNRVKEENERALKEYLMLRAIYDLRRSWRVVLPNLEQCALLEIQYKGLENASKDSIWETNELFAPLSPQHRFDIISNILYFFRTSYAIAYTNLKEKNRNRIERTLKENLKEPWSIGEAERIESPIYLRIKSIKKGRFWNRIETDSIGAGSALGKYFRDAIKRTLGEQIPFGDFEAHFEPILDILCQIGYLKKEVLPLRNRQEIPLYQLRINDIIWKLGDEVTVPTDNVRIRKFKEEQTFSLKVNEYFKKFYQQDFSQIRELRGEDHTGQVAVKDRQEREAEFREGNIHALFCSPTMELGIDISELSIVHLRNVPPNPANYAQRSGRAGRGGQGAIVFTYCSDNSPHDRHYFENKTDMVAGTVSPPRIDILNEELFITHINALYASLLGLAALNNSLHNLVNEDVPSKLPLKKEIQLQLKKGHSTRCQVVEKVFQQIMEEEYLTEKLTKTHWYNDKWTQLQADKVPQKLEEALKRWRKLLKDAKEMLKKARDVRDNPIYGVKSEERRNADRRIRIAKKSIDLLRNGSNRNFSEFYPYRYLASEGFLPGYNFTRLPLRTFIDNKNGEYISRPKQIALYEFGPKNLIYYNGAKYRIEKMMLQEAEAKMERALIANKSGYIFLNTSEKENEICPITKSALSNEQHRTIHTNLISMNETRAEVRDRISCKEEERRKEGYDIDTYFWVTGGLDNSAPILVKSGQQTLLKMYYIPTANLIHINKKWRRSQEEGYLMGMQTGFWKKKKDLEKAPEKQKEQIARVQLYVKNTADALYIQPVADLELGKTPKDTIITLQYALQRAIEKRYQVESSEIGVTFMGDRDKPNILIYEAAEGSLGILSQIAKENNHFQDIIAEAYSICHFQDKQDIAPQKPRATYDDLLSYYNQRHHQQINRHLIKPALEQLMACTIEILSKDFTSYEEQYQSMLEQMDGNSSTERRFLDYLYNNGLRLPDKAQVNMSEEIGIYAQADFVYKPNTCLFCDGTPHDLHHVREDDAAKRAALSSSGCTVLAWHYSEPLKTFVQRHSTIFRKVR